MEMQTRLENVINMCDALPQTEDEYAREAEEIFRRSHMYITRGVW
jgi:hypothetical protein